MKWDLDEAEGMFWIAVEAGYSLTKGMKNVYGFAFTRNVVLRFQNKLFKWYTLISENEELGPKFIEKFKDDAFREKIKKAMHDIKIELDKDIKKWQTENKEKLSINELFDYLKIFTQHYKDNFSYSFFAEPFDFVFPNIFKKAFSNYNLSQKEFISLSSVPDTSYLNIEEQELIKVILGEKELKDHFKEYEWMASGHIGKKKIGFDFFEKRMKELNKKDVSKELKRLQEFEKNEKSKQEEVIKKYDISKNDLELIELANDVAPLRDRRKEIFVKTIYYSDDVREEIGKRLKYSLEELQCFSLKELDILKEGELDKEEIGKRLEFVALDVDTKQNKFEIISGIENKKRFEEEFKEDYSSIDKIEGTCASMGYAKGKVKVIYGHEGFSKMKKGDIIFTGMTRPEMMPVMKLAAAIVTDEGGMTCHAAIVAREFGIPCVVGTIIGSKVFKDGDEVEVNADEGVVRKVK